MQRADRRDGAPSCTEPMWYAASVATIEQRGGPLARRVVRAAGWPSMAVDVTRVRLSPGEYAVSPGPRPMHDRRWQATGPDDTVTLAVQAAHPVLRVDGRAMPSDGQPMTLPAAAVTEGLPWPGSEPGEVIIALARRASPAEQLDQRRRCGRAFVGAEWAPVDALPDWAAERPLRFTSGYRPVGSLVSVGDGARDAMPDGIHEGIMSFDAIAAEPIFGACHPTWVAAHGGPIARAFVAALPTAWQTADADVIVNAKINEFEAGWSSCLAGWHIDGTSRIKKRSDGTPDLLDPGRSIEQIACNVGFAGATGFLIGDVALPVTPMGADGRGVWQRILLDAIDGGAMKATRAPVGQLVAFGFGDFHTCRPARRPGWRYFIKAMRGRGDTPQNAFAEATRISWPLDAGRWPDCPLGIFPPALPVDT